MLLAERHVITKSNRYWDAIHARFIEMLAYKAKLAGIKTVMVEEADTSKCSFLDLEDLLEGVELES